MAFYMWANDNTSNSYPLESQNDTQNESQNDTQNGSF